MSLLKPAGRGIILFLTMIMRYWGLASKYSTSSRWIFGPFCSLRNSGIQKRKSWYREYTSTGDFDKVQKDDWSSTSSCRPFHFLDSKRIKWLSIFISKHTCKVIILGSVNLILLHLITSLTGAVAVLLLLAVALLCAYELCAVYVTAGSSASERYSPSGFFFGVSAIALAINMLFICRMVFNGRPCWISILIVFFFQIPFCWCNQLLLFCYCNFLMKVFLTVPIWTGNGLDVDEYVRKAYRYAYSDCIEMGPLACLPEPPDPNELYPRQSKRQTPSIHAL